MIIPTNPVTPVVTLPPRISVYPKPPRGHDKPKDTSGNDKPKSTGGSYGDKPKSSGASNSDNSRGARGHNNDTSRTRVTNNAGASNVVRATAVKPIMSPVSMGIGLRAFGGMGMGRGMGWWRRRAAHVVRARDALTSSTERRTPPRWGLGGGLRRAAQRGGLSRASSGMCHADPQKRLCPVTGKATRRKFRSSVALSAQVARGSGATLPQRRSRTKANWAESPSPASAMRITSSRRNRPSRLLPGSSGKYSWVVSTGCCGAWTLT